jgi:cell wall-associated NlpC family hydrolase
MQCMATAMTAGAATTGLRAWVATHRPAWVTDRRLKLITAVILAAGVLASGAHLAPNGLTSTTARAASMAQPAAPSGSGAERSSSAVFDPAILVAVTAAKATGALEAIEGSLIFLGSKYMSEKQSKAEAEAPQPAQKPKPTAAAAGVGDGSPLPPASAGTNGTPVTPPPGIAGTVVARAPEPASANAASATATFVSGIALAPPDAPERIAGVINAANTIVGRPYIWGGGHGSWYSNGYDCSGAVSFALAGGGFIPRPLTSGELEGWGAPGPGRWLTVYASPSHTYAVIAGLRWDTVGDAKGTGPRWHLAGAVPAGFVARHPPGY